MSRPRWHHGAPVSFQLTTHHTRTWQLRCLQLPSLNQDGVGLRGSRQTAPPGSPPTALQLLPHCVLPILRGADVRLNPSARLQLTLLPSPGSSTQLPPCTVLTPDDAEMGSVLCPPLLCFLITFHPAALTDHSSQQRCCVQPYGGPGPTSRAGGRGCPYPET